MIKKLVSVLWVALLGAIGSAAVAAPTYFASRPVFAGQLGASVTDDYANPGYVSIQSNAAMSAVLGETDYRSTHFSDWNIVTGQTYCAGCNGSFELGFATTSVGNASGVFGVGLDVVGNSGIFAFVTFGDGSTDNVLVTGSFFGLTSPQAIKTIHFGLSGGVATNQMYFQIDNLTIGDAAAQVPEPASLALLAMALLGLAAARRFTLPAVRPLRHRR